MFLVSIDLFFSGFCIQYYSTKELDWNWEQGFPNHYVEFQPRTLDDYRGVHCSCTHLHWGVWDLGCFHGTLWRDPLSSSSNAGISENSQQKITIVTDRDRAFYFRQFAWSSNTVLAARNLKNYPPVNWHGNGNSPFPIGNTSSNGGFSIAMLVYPRVSKSIKIHYDYVPPKTTSTTIDEDWQVLLPTLGVEKEMQGRRRSWNSNLLVDVPWFSIHFPLFFNYTAPPFSSYRSHPAT